MEGNKTLGEIQLTEWWAVGRQVAVNEGWEGGMPLLAKATWLSSYFASSASERYAPENVWKGWNYTSKSINEWEGVLRGRKCKSGVSPAKKSIFISISQRVNTYISQQEQPMTIFYTFVIIANLNEYITRAWPKKRIASLLKKHFTSVFLFKCTPFKFKHSTVQTQY